MTDDEKLRQALIRREQLENMINSDPVFATLPRPPEGLDVDDEEGYVAHLEEVSRWRNQLSPDRQAILAEAEAIDDMLYPKDTPEGLYRHALALVAELEREQEAKKKPN